MTESSGLGRWSLVALRFDVDLLVGPVSSVLPFLEIVEEPFSTFVRLLGILDHN